MLRLWGALILFVFVAVLTLQNTAKSGILEDIAAESDKCGPANVSDHIDDESYEADFVWYSDFENCGAFGKIYSFVRNTHKTNGLIFTWEKGRTWADRSTPLAPGAKSGNPILVKRDSAAVDLDAPIRYTQGYRRSVTAAVYMPQNAGSLNPPPPELDDAADPTKVKEPDSGADATDLKSTDLETKIETGVILDGTILKVQLTISSYIIEDRIWTTVYNATPAAKIVAITGVPEFLESLPDSEAETVFKGISASLSEVGAKAEIDRLEKRLDRDRAEYVPTGLLPKMYLFITNTGEKIQFSLPIGESGPDTVVADFVALTAEGAVLGNGPIALWLP